MSARAICCAWGRPLERESRAELPLTGVCLARESSDLRRVEQAIDQRVVPALQEIEDFGPQFESSGSDGKESRDSEIETRISGSHEAVPADVAECSGRRRREGRWAEIPAILPIAPRQIRIHAGDGVWPYEYTSRASAHARGITLEIDPERKSALHTSR